MKSKAIQFLVTSIIVLVTLTAMLFFYFCPSFNAQQLLLNILYGIFGGAILSFALTIVEYINVKRETINDFYDEYTEFLRIIHNISFLDITELEKIVAKYASFVFPVTNDIPERTKICENAVKELNNIGVSVTFEGVAIFLKLQNDAFIKNLNETILSYIDVSKHRLTRLSKLTNSIYFLSPLFRKKHKEHFELFKAADELLAVISNKSSRFDLYIKKGAGHEHQITEWVNELNELVYRIERNGGSTVVWEEKYNILSDKLSYFYSISTKSKYQKADSKPFYYANTTLFSNERINNEFKTKQ